MYFHSDIFYNSERHHATEVPGWWWTRGVWKSRFPSKGEMESMCKNCVPYPRKRLYLLLTVPMLGMYVAIAAFLWQASLLFFVTYLSLFVIVVISQSCVCVHWRCPYIGKFAPCVGGICLPSSQIARLFQNVTFTEKAYNIIVTVALVSFLGIIVVPVYFLYRQSILYLLGYIGIVLIYAVSFLWRICPVCETRHVCPGGQTSAKFRKIIGGK